ncbi:MAG: thiamine pyrophosphate-binding protein, partial [Beijerinckiaceae bacterium]|nr:thiamine pyrophosphate-binding protein [Beijerinckiaceae bacterium]
MKRVADTIGQTLAAHGIHHAFGVPGGEVVTLIDGLAAAGIEFHLTRNETAAAIMAAGTAMRSQTPGLLVTTIGPGLTNAVNGIADASQEHVPLLVISGVADRQTRALYTHQVIDHAAILRPLVKASFEIEQGAAGQTIARAIALATAEPPGPVHLDLAPGVAVMQDGNAPVIRPAKLFRPNIADDDRSIKHVAGLLNSAKRVLIMAGYEAVRAQAGAQLLDLAEKLNAPVITTYKAKGIIPEDHILALGGAGLSPAADEILLDIVRQSDVIVMVGYDPIEMRLGWLGIGHDQVTIEISNIA